MVYSNALQILLLILLFPFVYPSTQPRGRDSQWGYERPQNWGLISPICNGKRQSPIHIRSNTSTVLPLSPIIFGNYKIPLSGLTLHNNGHSVDIEITETTNGRRPYITGGTLKSKYEAVSFHYHWGSKGKKGSEHVIDNRRCDVEMHIVHKNVKYATVDRAYKHKDGLTVLAILFKLINNPNRYFPGLNKIFNKIPKIVKYNSTAAINGQIRLGQLLGDLNTNRFFTYNGSLTTPNCAQAVTWNVFPKPLPIAAVHMKNFWSMLDSHGKALEGNNRPLQDRNGRKVFYRVGDS